jgi:hypothetical protein
LLIGASDVALDLATGSGSGAADAVFVEGTHGADDIAVAGITEATVSGLTARTAIRTIEPGRDTLRMTPSPRTTSSTPSNSPAASRSTAPPATTCPSTASATTTCSAAPHPRARYRERPWRPLRRPS